MKTILFALIAGVFVFLMTGEKSTGIIVMVLVLIWLDLGTIWRDIHNQIEQIERRLDK